MPRTNEKTSDMLHIYNYIIIIIIRMNAFIEFRHIYNGKRYMYILISLPGEEGATVAFVFSSSTGFGVSFPI